MAPGYSAVMSRALTDYALLSDCHSAALVSTDGTVEWLCLPRFDSPSVFARLLDDQGGHWLLRPKGVVSARRGYRERSLILETRLSTHTGRGLRVDAMVFGEGERGHSIGLASPHVLVRQLICLEGEFEVYEEVVPRPGYGAETPRVEALPGGVGFGYRDGRLVLSTDRSLEELRGGVCGSTRIVAGQTCHSALAYIPVSEPSSAHLYSGEQITRMIEDAAEGWRTWSSSHQNYDGPWSDMVYRSGSVMQGLTYRPTGAMVAAPTTSLPESVGGGRNWDYRYSWLRDSSMTLQALWVAACPDEAGQYFRWMARTAERDAGKGLPLQILYGIGGERDLPETELSHLRGWRDSRPVRVGNAAGGQRQIDIYGEVLDAASRLLPTVDILDAATSRFLVGLADAASTLWSEPDQGIWEVRGGPRHFVYSKMMCWVALDRAIAMADRLDAMDRVAPWARARRAIRTAVESRGWNATLGAFTQSFDDDALDASALMLGITGFLSPTDSRMVSTLRRIADELTDDRGLVLRYHPRGGATDGVSGGEGAFLLCTYWLAELLAKAGQSDEAREVFERATAHANDVGLLAEEVDSATGEPLGNFPQALSHIGLVNAAWAIAEQERAGGQASPDNRTIEKGDPPTAPADPMRAGPRFPSTASSA